MGIHPATVVLALAFLGAGGFAYQVLSMPAVAAALAAIGVLCGMSIRVASQWQAAVLLRFGRYAGLKGPGLFTIFPFIDTIPIWIDRRTMSTPFNAEQTLTKDSVPVDVDAVLFWRVTAPEKAALEVANYKEAIFWAAQTALRDVMGKADISELLVGRETIDEALRELIDSRAVPWGIEVLAVEIRDVKIPPSLQNAMSMQAQAVRERQARVILADSERLIADVFCDAAERYHTNPEALQLRAMNVLLEGMREGSSMLIVPSTAVETMGLGTTAGLASLARDAAQARAQIRDASGSGRGRAMTPPLAGGGTDDGHST